MGHSIGGLELAGFDVVGLLAWEQVDEHSIQAALADVIIVDANAPGRDTLEQIPPNTSGKIPTPRAHS